MDDTDIQGYLNSLEDDEESSAPFPATNDAASYLAQMYGSSSTLETNGDYNRNISQTIDPLSPSGWNPNDGEFNTGSDSVTVIPGMLPINSNAMMSSSDPFLVPNINVSGETSDTSSIHPSSTLNSPYLSPTISNSQIMPTFDTSSTTSFTELENFENLNINQPILEWPSANISGSSDNKSINNRIENSSSSATVAPPEININYFTEETASPTPSITTSSVSEVEFDNIFSKQKDAMLSPNSGIIRNRQRSLSDSALKRQQNRTTSHINSSSNNNNNTNSLSPPTWSTSMGPTGTSPDPLGSYPSPQQSYLSPTASVGSEAPRRSRSTSNRTSSSASRSRSRSRSSNRDYILELATPSQPHKRVQKHPSAFACHMCDKKFTRAYNLRSHLRTHTDERPFICTVCGKAFARQHDRKRHEALHSGEKKFECSGVLSDGITRWGCGRKFARADALGRHFRTAAGKLCIKPLLDEEHNGNLSSDGQVFVSGVGQTPSLTLSPPPSNDMGKLPNALLQQFPSLISYGGDLSGSEIDDEEE